MRPPSPVSSTSPSMRGPNNWKKANVMPIFTKGTKGDHGNYRPVSLTSGPCRTMESCLRDVIVDHLGLPTWLQKTETNLLEFLERLTVEQDQGNNMDVVYLEFSKAFDKVPHRCLLEKLRAHSIDSKVLNWIEAWLTSRTQRTVLNGEASDWSYVTSGVPQGSVLGPLAFIVFINDIDDVTVNITIMNKFADDTKCGNVIRSPSDISDLQDCLDSLVDWAEKWGMSFNIKKCKVMYIGRTNPRSAYTMNNVAPRFPKFLIF